MTRAPRCTGLPERLTIVFRLNAGEPVPAVSTGQMREVDRSMTEDFGIDLAQMTENAGPNLADLGQALAGGGSSCNGARAPATPPRRYRSGAGGEFSPVDDLDDAVADPDQAIVFQVFKHLVQRGPLDAEHGGQGALRQFHPPIDCLFGQ